MGGITHHANEHRQPFSDSTTRGFRGETVALVDTGVVGTRPVPLGLQYAVTAGGIPRGRGRSTPSGTGFLSPNAQHVPGREKVHPRTQDVPRRKKVHPHAQYVPADRRRREDVDSADRRLHNGGEPAGCYRLTPLARERPSRSTC